MLVTGVRRGIGMTKGLRAIGHGSPCRGERATSPERRAKDLVPLAGVSGGNHIEIVFRLTLGQGAIFHNQRLSGARKAAAPATTPRTGGLSDSLFHSSPHSRS